MPLVTFDHPFHPPQRRSAAGARLATSLEERTGHVPEVLGAQNSARLPGCNIRV